MKKLLSVLAILAVSALSLASEMKSTSGEAAKEMPKTTSGAKAN